MSEIRHNVLGVPTNLITGFLGAGKTSAILHLLEQKPADERWAILINEFGEIGVDGSLLEGQTENQPGVYISEVPGGCMCCAAGLPMQIALNRLLRRAKPHRLLVEPTGLGHPLEVLQALSTQHYRNVLSLQKTMTLVDARNFADERYASHPTFLQQLEIADVIVGNKEDLYATQDKANLVAYVDQHCAANVELVVTRYGQLGLEKLEGATLRSFKPRGPHVGEEDVIVASDLPLPESGYLTAVNGGGNFESIGWRFSPEKVFERARLHSFLMGLNVERMKGVFITGEGVFGYNLASDVLTEIELDDCSESRIEIIADRVDLEWEAGLITCLDTGR